LAPKKLGRHGPLRRSWRWFRHPEADLEAAIGGFVGAESAEGEPADGVFLAS